MAGFVKNILRLRNRAEDAAANLPALITRANDIAQSVLQGAHAQRKSGGHEKFWQFREYMQGDRPQDIDWRQSAKTQRVYIRQKEWQNTQDNMFWCSRYTGMDFQSKNNPSKGEVAKIMTMALSILMTKAGERVGFLEGDTAGRSEKSLEDMGMKLCADHRTENLPSTDHYITKHSNLFLIGDFLDDLDTIKQSLNHFAGRSENIALIQILDPAELNLPYDGRVVFEDMDSAAQETVSHVKSIRAQYQGRIQRHVQDIAQLCRDHDWPYTLYKTDENIIDTLRIFWQEIRG